MQNIITRLLLVLGIITFLTGCSNKINKKIIQEKLEENKFMVVDLSDKNRDMLLGVSDHYQIYFHGYKNKTKALNELKKEIRQYNNMKKIDMKSCQKYIKDSNNVYTIYVLKNNSYIFISAPNKYKNEINKLIKSIDFNCQ